METENHDVILAAGAPVESYVDNVTRRAFDNHAEYEALYGAEPRAMVELPYARAMSRRQLPARILAALQAREVATGAAGIEAA